MTVSWSPIGGVSGYNLYYTVGSSGFYHGGTLAAGVSSPYTVTGLTNGSNYTFTVTAFDGSGESPGSSPVTVRAGIPGGTPSPSPTPTPPLAPTPTPTPTPAYYQVTFMANGGTGTMPAQTLMAGTTAPLIACAFAYTGFTFAGWNTASSGTGTAYADMAPFTIGAANVQLYAQWTAIPLVGQGHPLVLSATVTTLAGSNVSLVTGSTDATGIAASFNSPWGITTDGSNLYVTDQGNHLIRKIVISTGAVTTLSGSGASGSTDGPAGSASFKAVCGITTDGVNLYVADRQNFEIRKVVISTGAVSTLAGSSGSLGTNDGTGSGASFSNPMGITTDGTNLYVADNGAHNIRKIVIATGVVTTLAGTAGSSGSTNGTGTGALFSYPDGITTDGVNLYVADTGNSQIRKIVIATGAVTTLAGVAGSTGSTDGPGSSAKFSGPIGITTDGTNLYVTDNGNSIIRQIVISTGAVSTLAGTAGLTGMSDATGPSASFFVPNGITCDGTSLVVADNGNNNIRRIQ